MQTTGMNIKQYNCNRTSTDSKHKWNATVKFNTIRDQVQECTVWQCTNKSSDKLQQLKQYHGQKECHQQTKVSMQVQTRYTSDTSSNNEVVQECQRLQYQVQHTNKHATETKKKHNLQIRTNQARATKVQNNFKQVYNSLGKQLHGSGMNSNECKFI
jgi:hypothetical protein